MTDTEPLDIKASGGDKVIILGGGMTGLAAGMISGHPVYEAAEGPGGIGASYYMTPGRDSRTRSRPADDEAYRFEIGGGHWLFGDKPLILKFIHSLTPLVRYQRRSAVFFPDNQLKIPYPIQNNLRFFGEPTVRRILPQINASPKPCRSLKGWLLHHFGKTLYDLFFGPFHELYTAGLTDRIAPQDENKSPIEPHLIRGGAHHSTPPVGYNITYAYPIAGLGELARKMASRCQMQYQKKASHIDARGKTIFFEDGSRERYDAMVSTIPLNRLLKLVGLDTGESPWPHTSVLVLNVGAIRGPRCPDDHWLYLPSTRSGFHRVGFYSNVTTDFLPISSRSVGNKVSIYIEKAFRGGAKASPSEIESFTTEAVGELRDWGFIREVETWDPTWIDTGYTWALPRSDWRKKSLELLHRHHIYPVGRYGRWKFQGILDSIEDGFVAGASLRGISQSVEEFLSRRQT